jgi:hypothetical protein
MTAAKHGVGMRSYGNATTRPAMLHTIFLFTLQRMRESTDLGLPGRAVNTPPFMIIHSYETTYALSHEGVQFRYLEVTAQWLARSIRES